jgi:hypothetical protein
MKTTLTPLRLIRVTACLMSILLFLIWGLFFISHLYWFFPPEPTPPVEVWFGQAILLGLVISYPLSFWKEKAAAILMTVCALFFFFLVVGSGGAIAYFVLSIIPAILYFITTRMGTTPMEENKH